MGNIKLLKDTRDMIVMNPQTHNQKTWACGTTMCIAGHAAVLSGEAFVVQDVAYGPVFLDGLGEHVSAAGVADEELQLSSAEYGYLFFCMDNATSIKRMDQVIQLWEEGKTLEDLPYEQWIPAPEDEDDE